MKITNILTVLVAVCCASYIRAADVLLFSVTDLEKNVQFRWTIEQDKWRAMPKFQGFDKRSVIDLRRALELALQSCKANVQSSTITLESARFRQPRRVEDRNGVFYYFVTFEIIGPKGELSNYDVLVLPNGKVLAPSTFQVRNRGNVRTE